MASGDLHSFIYITIVIENNLCALDKTLHNKILAVNWGS